MAQDMKDKPDEYWKAKLTPEQYAVLRQKGTEVPGSGELLNNEGDGMYHCVACGAPLFSSETKYESTTPGLIGWPSFAEAATSDSIEYIDDNSYGMRRTEVICKNCGGHLGHIFPDDKSPGGQHLCINSVCLDFKPQAAK